MKSIHERMVALDGKRHLLATFSDMDLSPGKTRDRIDRMQMDGMYETGERDPGDAGHEKQIVLIVIIFQGRIITHMGDSLHGPISEL